MRFHATSVGIVALIPFTFILSARSAQAQGCQGVGVTGEICSIENSPSEEQQRRSDEADRQVHEQAEARARQQEEDYNYYSQQQAKQAQPAAPGNSNLAPPVRRDMSPNTTRLSANPSVAAYQRGNYPLAFTLTRQQASKGDLNAWHNLGYFYERGIGTRPDPLRARQWYQACADLNRADCQLELGRLYYTGGIGLPRDPVEAYKWLLLAGRQSAVARQNMPEVRRILSYTQLVEATNRYQAWKPAASVHTPDSAPPHTGH